MMIACVKCHELRAVLSCSVVSHSLWPTRLLCPWDFSVKNEWVAIFLLQGNLPDAGIKPGLPHLKQTLYRLSHQGSLENTNWIDNSFVFLACVTLCFYYTAKLYLGIDFIKLQNFYEPKFFLWQAHLYVSHLILTTIQYDTVQYTHFKE